MIVTQQPAQSFTTSHRLLAADVGITREQQDIALPLVIAFRMVMLNIFAQRIVAGVTRRRYAGDAQVTVFSTVLIF
jgi:hypothetical protein